jgi:monoamine oxidase
MAKKVYDVVIIGAGVSGLSAALVAKEKGLTYKIIDARNRIGGRVYSQKLKNGLVIERGGEWLGKTHKEILGFCRKHGVKLEPHRYKHPRYFTREGHEYAPFKDLLQRFDNLVDEVKIENIPAKEDWYDFWEDKFSEDEMQVIANVYGSDYGTHMRYVAARNAFTELTLGGNNDHLDYHVKGGNTKMIEAMVKAVGRKNIDIETEVTDIEDTGEAVTVKTKQRLYTGKKVLLTVALPEFKELNIDPPLKKKKDVARGVHYGDITKAFLAFKGRLPRKQQGFSMHTETDFPYIYVATQGQSEERFALCVYAVGSLARKVHKMRHEVLAKKVLALLPADTFPLATMELEEVVVQNWGTDKYTHGAYCHYGPGKWEEVKKAFGVPHGNIYFAGAYLGEFSGYMNGAFQSGRDVMRALAKDVKKSVGK